MMVKTIIGATSKLNGPSEELDGGPVHVVHQHDVRFGDSVHPRAAGEQCDGVPPMLPACGPEVQAVQGFLD